MTPIELYTDGACSGNPGPGGFAWILKWNQHVKEHAEAYRLTTNNRMELMAVISGLSNIRKKEIPVRIFSDSKYVVDAILQKWLENWISKKFHRVANADLWMEFLKIYNPALHHFEWVKGHAENKWNNRCDLLAVEASRKGPFKEDVGYIV